MKKILLYFLLPKVICEKIYNYYELAIQKWCTDDYMIHGLWPQIDSEHYPTYCEDLEYTTPNDNLISSMEIYWKSCNNDLWKHEWLKHGSCIKKQNNITENDFFNITIQLFNSYKYLINENCNIEDDNCIIACFDLDYNLIHNTM